DPAAGTLTFPAEAAKLAVEEFKGKYGTGNRERLIREHILKNFYAFELMMAPYAIGHIKISFLLEELGYALKGDDRFNLYLTNTLEMEEIHATNLPGMASLSEESEAAGKVKKQIPILVIMGNPPYSGHSSNKYEEVKEYYQVDGKPLKEKNPKWLQDDYVKFIRFSQWKIDQAGEGVLGFITNHGYLDNPTFRGMRQSLLKSFDEIYLLDLHGNSKKKETSPDGSKDENVFDNQQGVAIGLFIKKKGDGVKGDAKVYHADLYGRREEKYRWLEEKDIHTTDWRQLTPHSETYFFMPRDEKLLGRYEKHPKIPDIFLVNSVGIVTARDNLTIQWTPEQIRKIIMLFPRMDSESARTTYQLGKDARDWKVELAQRDLLESGMDNSRIQPILYRPFDIRYTYYTGKSRGFLCMPRPEVMRHMLRENLGLITRRQMLPNHPCNYVFISNKLISDGVIRSDNKGSESLFPLYLYPEKGEPHIFSSTDSQKEREPNLNSAIVGRLSETYGRQPLPEEVLYYVYAVLYAPAYRSRYAEFLKSDFPRIPFTG
ncbi:MAG TPA: DNA methyltransferase, partial [bacterium]|nr:DNA methyltransferase [bacterium]